MANPRAAWSANGGAGVLAAKSRPRQRWRLGDKIGGEAVESNALAADHDGQHAGAVADPARQPVAVGKAAHEGAKADALHSADNAKLAGLDLPPRSPRRTHHRALVARVNAEGHAQARSLLPRAPADHQMRHAPSSETMHGPTG